MYRPACRKNQTGGRSVERFKQARTNRVPPDIPTGAIGFNGSAESGNNPPLSIKELMQRF
jgi:hypothetical protein